MGTGDGDVSTSPASGSDDAAELTAVEAEIARLSLRRDELRARLGAADADFAAPTAGTPVAGAATAATVAAGTAAAGTAASTGAAALARADWYPDPLGRFSWRYWNGREWTDAVARNGITYTDPPTVRPSFSATPSSGSATQTQPGRPTTGSATTGSSSAEPRTEPVRPAAGTPGAPASSGPTTQPGWSSPAAKPARTRPDIDVGKLILIVGAALLVGGLAGLTVWLVTELPPLGRLVLLGLAATIQIVAAFRMRKRLPVAAEALATTGAASLLLAVGAVAFRAGPDGTVGVVVGLVGIGLLLFARFRAWVIAGQLAIVVGAVSVMVQEPWSQTALIVAVVVGAVRVISTRAKFSFRPEEIDVFPAGLTAGSLAALLAAPVLAGFQFDNAVPTAIVFTLVALAVSEIAVRSRTSMIERDLSLVAGAFAAIGGVAWSAALWLDGSRSGGLVGLWVTGVVALLLWRVGRIEEKLRLNLMTLAIILVPFAARFATNPGSGAELIVFSGGMAVAGLVAARFIEKRFSLWLWTSAVFASVAATEDLAAWPRLALATIAFASAVQITKIDGLRYAAAGAATITVADLLYGDTFTVTWWFRPDVLGAAAAVFLFAAVRTWSKPQMVRIEDRVIPRYLDAAVALMAVPVVGVASQPALADLGSESFWRLGFIGALTVGSWAYGAVRRKSPNALQVVSLVGVVAVLVSRVGDESGAVRTGAWAAVGTLATIALAWLASSRKLDDLRYLAAGTATGTVAILLYGELFTVTWWYRPDVLGVAAAVFLYVAVRTRTTPLSVSIGGRQIPRYWEPAVALVVVPVAALVMLVSFVDLESESVWRLGFIGALTAVSWAYGAARRKSPNALQLVSLLAATAVMVSRVADTSETMQALGWVVVGCLFVGAALVFRRVGLLIPAAGSWMLVVSLYSPPGPLEVLTCSLAAVAALVALIGRRFGRKGSLDFIPATALALVPSTFAAAGAVLDGTVDSEQVTRIAVVVLVGAVALAVGTYRRLAALVGPSVVALIVLAGAQLVVVQRSTSGWVSALVAGVLLLLVGTRLEYLRSVSKRTGDLVRSLR